MRITYVRAGLIAIVTVLIVGSAVFIHTRANAPQVAQPLASATTTERATDTAQTAHSAVAAKSAASVPAVPEKQVVPVSVQAQANTSTIDPANAAAITIDGKPYTVAANQTLKTAMDDLQARGAITYSGRTYTGLGFFIDSINGRKAANGYNWMFYVNGAQSQAGASITTVHAGDRIEWRYEK